MTRKEVLDAVASLNDEQRTQWLITFGWQLTISARAYYPLGPEGGSLKHVIAFNEIQHQVYNYLRHSQAESEWTIEQFLTGLCDKASASDVEGYFGTALKFSLRAIAK